MPTGGTGATQRPASKEDVAGRIMELSRNPSKHWAELEELQKQLKEL
jgi:hypothetical protein